jgi:SAM-dependent methyltransferase
MGSFAIRLSSCPACGPTLLVRYQAGEMGVRCLRCRATPVTLSLIEVLRGLHPDLPGLRVFELSSRGALVRFLQKQRVQLTLSEYFDDVAPGSVRDGVQCQDVMALTFADRSFDLCTSTEVFEHVPDDARGFAEIHRVLRPGGHFVFTVPMTGTAETVTRAVAGPKGPVHLLEPEFHGDRLRGPHGVLCYRTYGGDIVQRLRTAGFASAAIVVPRGGWFGFARNVIVAQRAPESLQAARLPD